MDLPAPRDGRDGNGRFAPGNRLSKGNPHARRVHKLRSVLLKAATPARMKRVALTLLRLAESGDVPAAKLLLQYTIGNPDQRLDVDLQADVRTATAAVVRIVELPDNGRDRLPEFE